MSALTADLHCTVQVQDLTYLADSMGGSAFSQRFKALSAGLCEVGPAVRLLLVHI